MGVGGFKPHQPLMFPDDPKPGRSVPDYPASALVGEHVTKPVGAPATASIWPLTDQPPSLVDIAKARRRTQE